VFPSLTSVQAVPLYNSVLVEGLADIGDGPTAPKQETAAVCNPKPVP